MGAGLNSYRARRGPSSSVEPETLADEAYEKVKEMIRGGELIAGSKITEATLTRELEMSRTPVREAMARIAAEGLLQPTPGRGYVVVEITAQDLINVYRVRAELEGLAAEEAAKRVQRVDLARLEDLYEDMSVAKDEGRDNDLALLNSSFHGTVAEISGNTYLQAMLDDIRNVFDRYRRTALTVPGRRDKGHEEHGQIIEALRRKNGAAARKLARLHVQHALAARQSTFTDEEVV